MKKKFIFPAVVYAIAFILPLFSQLAVPASKTDGTDLLILMYHSVLRDTARTGKYVITPANFENDLIYLKNHGYTFVTAKQVIQYANTDAKLPEKPVLLTFDDGMYNNLEYVLPILEKHDAYAVFSVVGSYTDEYSEKDIKNPAYSYLRWCDINSLAKSGRIEFANHSYDFHASSGKRQGASKMRGESAFDYIEAFYSDTQKLQSEFLSNCNFEPYIYAYPFGNFNNESNRVLRKMGFLMSFSCIEGINRIERNADCLYLLKRFNRDGRLSSEEFFAKL